jgi:hypothetical protein
MTTTTRLLGTASALLLAACGGATCPPTWGADCAPPLVGRYTLDLFAGNPLPGATLPEVFDGTLEITEQSPHENPGDDTIARRYSDVRGVETLASVTWQSGGADKTQTLGTGGAFHGVVNEQTGCVILDGPLGHWQGAITKNAAGATVLDFHHTGNPDTHCTNAIDGVAIGAEGFATRQ